MTASGLFISCAAPAAISPTVIIVSAAKDFALRGLQLAIRLGELLGERARFFADLRGAQCQAPAAGDRGEFLDLRAEPLRFARLRAPDDAADADAVGFEADPEALLVREPRRDGGEQPFQFLAGRQDRPIAGRGLRPLRRAFDRDASAA